MPAVKPWFKAKKYGWGWTPQTFEGYLTTFIYLVLYVGLIIIYAMRITDPLFSPIVSTAIFLTLIVALTISLMAICYAKGEKPAWRWPASTKIQRGEKNKKKKS